MEGRWHPSGRIKHLDFSGERRKQMRNDIMSVSQALYHDRGGFTIRGIQGIDFLKGNPWKNPFQGAIMKLPGPGPVSGISQKNR